MQTARLSERDLHHLNHCALTTTVGYEPNALIASLSPCFASCGGITLSEPLEELQCWRNGAAGAARASGRISGVR